MPVKRAKKTRSISHNKGDKRPMHTSTGNSSILRDLQRSRRSLAKSAGMANKLSHKMNVSTRPGGTTLKMKTRKKKK